MMSKHHGCPDCFDCTFVGSTERCPKKIGRGQCVGSKGHKSPCVGTRGAVRLFAKALVGDMVAIARGTYSS